MKRPQPQAEATRTFISIDMDAFYCGVEQKLDPSLRDEPFIVAQKNVAATVSYAARAAGIKKLQRVSEILELFPTIRIVNGESLARYRAAGLEIFQYLTNLIPEVERLGLEEFRFEVTDELSAAYKPLRRVFRAADSDNLESFSQLGHTFSFQMFGQAIEYPDFFWEVVAKTFPPDCNGFFTAIPPETYLATVFAHNLMDKIKLELGFDCSMGIASSKHIAKIATSRNKPHGLFVVIPGFEAEFMQTCQIGSIPGLGHSAQSILFEKYQLAKSDTIKTLHSSVSQHEFCQSFGEHLYNLTIGIDNSDIVHWTGPTQISKEETFNPFISTTKCLPTMSMLVDSLLAQAREEMVKDGKWVQNPLRFRVTIATNNIRGQGRKAKSVALPPTADEEVDFRKLAKNLVYKGFQMIDGLIEEPIRVLNISLVFKET